MRDKHQDTEEPCEVKVSCTVLETNGVGDNLVEFNRSTHDVQQGIFNQLKANAKGLNKRILELDIEICFDKIDHKFLMQSVQLPRAAKQGLFRAIKAGVRGEFPSSVTGTPQGGVISPLLANLVLHGLENVGIRCNP